ncbi:NACHT domain-containing protein [Micromonospora sp. NPDC048839]|uniref:NACHT domain-containing protein n=1 Tax=Micromonospora sp. NPDC048839 TaxID=3155641 RepID=UPI0033FAD4CA
MTGIIEAAFSILAKVAAQPTLDFAKRQEAVIRTLKQLHLDPRVPPRDFEALYAYSLVEFGYGKPNQVLDFFRDEHLRDAFWSSFSTNDWSRWNDEAGNLVDRLSESRDRQGFGSWIKEELPYFLDVFHRLVDRSRPAADARLELKVDEIRTALDNLERVRIEEESKRQDREPERASATPAERLAGDLAGWFRAVGYLIDAQLSIDDESFEWLIRVPVRRGRFEHVVVLGTDGELAVSHVARMQRRVSSTNAVEGWCVAPRRVSAAAREFAAKGNQSVTCYTFDELLDEDADFEPYIDWLEKEVGARQIEEQYVPLSCVKSEYDKANEKGVAKSEYDWRTGGLDSYVTSWLEDPSKEHLSLLGEFGTGKTWFTLHFAWQIAKLWRVAKEKGLPRPRLPLVIPLRDYAKAVTVESLFSEFFFRKHEILPGGYSVFRELNQMGRLLLIFDGFDEMAARVDRQAMVNNFWELASVVVPGAKVLLSCRTEHFPTDKEGRDLLAAKLRNSTINLDPEVPRFEVVELKPFDDDQVRLMLRNLTDEPTTSLIMNDDVLLDLMRRPVMSELVLDALPEIEAGAKMDLARVYLYAVRRKIDRDIRAERTFTSFADKLYFMCELSWEMLSSGKLSINYREFPQRIRQLFGTIVEEASDLDYWHHDMRSQTLLIRNAGGDYAPAHKSLLEFLVAFKIAAQMGALGEEFLDAVEPTPAANSYRWSEYFLLPRREGRLPEIASFQPEAIEEIARTVGGEPPTEALVDFLSSMVGDQREQLLNIISAMRKTPGSTGYLGALTLGLLSRIAVSETAALDLSGLSLPGINKEFYLMVPNLSQANLQNCDLRSGNVRHIYLVDADARGANLDTEELLRGGRAVWGMGFSPSGCPIARVGDSILKWSSDDLETQPKVIFEGAMKRDWRGGRFLSKGLMAIEVREFSGPMEHHLDRGYRRREWAILDTGVGRVVHRVAGAGFTNLIWQGRPALAVLEDPLSNRCNIVDPVSFSSIGTLEFPISLDDLYVFHSPEFGICYLDHASRNIYRRQNNEWLQFLDLDKIDVREISAVEDSNEPSFWHFNDGHFWIYEGTASLYSINGNLLWRSGEYQSSPVGFELLPDGRTILAATRQSVDMFRIDSPSPQWSTPLALGANLVEGTNAHDKVLVSTNAGELLTIEIATGVVKSRISFNQHLRGLRLSESLVTRRSVRDSLELSGVIFD